MGPTWGKEEKEIITNFDENGEPSGMCKILIRGTGQKVRGLKYGAYRPTLTIIDDGEGEANTLTEMSRDKFKRWFNAAVIQALLTQSFVLLEPLSTITRI